MLYRKYLAHRLDRIQQPVPNKSGFIARLGGLVDEAPDLVSIWIEDVAPRGCAADRAPIRQK